MFRVFVLLGVALAISRISASSIFEDGLRVRVKRQEMTLQQSFQNLQNTQQQHSQAQRRPQQSGNSLPTQQGSAGGFANGGDPNFGVMAGSSNERPSTSGGNTGGFDPDAFNGPGFGNGNQQQGTGGSSNQQGGSGGGANSGAGNQGSGGTGNGNRPQGSGTGNQRQTSTTVRSPLNPIQNENTIPEAACVQRCRSVGNYDPVCGSDNISYTNRAKFRCAQQCGRGAVVASLQRLISATSLPQKWPQARREWLMENHGFGKTNKHRKPGFGHENLAFDNGNQQWSVVFYNKQHRGNQESRGFIESRGSGNRKQPFRFGSGNVRQPNTPQPWTTMRPPAPALSNENSVAEILCIQRCSSVNNYNPICGSDNITYSNRVKLTCARQCGRMVSESHSGSCSAKP